VLALRRRALLEVLTAFVDSQQIGDEFARHGQCGTVAMSAFQLAGMQRPLVADSSAGPAWRPRSTWFAASGCAVGDRPALLLAGRRLQGSRQPAITHGVGAGVEALRIANLQGPGQSGNFSTVESSSTARRAAPVRSRRATRAPAASACSRTFPAHAAQAQQIDYRLWHFFEFFQQVAKYFLRCNFPSRRGRRFHQ